PSCSLSSTRHRPVAAHPCSPDSDGTRSSGLQSPARKSAPAPLGARLAPPGRAPPEYPRGVSLFRLAWESTPAESPADDNCRPRWLASVRPSRLHLPASLRSRPITAFLSYSGRSDSCRASRDPAGLPDSRTRPSDHSVSNHLRTLRLAKARSLSAGRIETASPRGNPHREPEASPFSSRLATPRRPNRVRYPTDWPFTSCCSPPRLAAAQLQSVTSYVDLERTFTSP